MTRIDCRAWRITLCLLTIGSLVCADEDIVEAEFSFDESAWSESDGIVFANQWIDGPAANDWGNEAAQDFYAEATSAGGQVDITIPSIQFVRNADAIVLEFETRYLSSTQSHSYVAFGTGGDDGFWFGYGGGSFRAGTGSEFDLSGTVPGGVTQNIAVAQQVTNDSRIGVRAGFDILNSTFTNLQIDTNNDNAYDIELLEAPLEVDSSTLFPEDWFLVTYAGRAGARADNIFVRQVSLTGDYNSNLEFDAGDADLLCAGIATGGSEFDFNGDGTVNRSDADDYAWENGSLTGDFDFDGTVTFVDFLTLAERFGGPGTWSDGDANCDGGVGFFDFLIMAEFFGSSAGGDRPGTQNVPEPTSQHVLYFVLLCCARARQRRQ